ncbi:hypothetical protein NQZ68_022622 [Dissostichus eleginoides]|nr:hypothetical protein NQZ68_022622 [Dissostichus eleginoides]
MEDWLPFGDAETFPNLHLLTSTTHQMKRQLDDLLARDRNSPSLWKSHAWSQRPKQRESAGNESTTFHQAVCRTARLHRLSEQEGDGGRERREEKGVRGGEEDERGEEVKRKKEERGGEEEERGERREKREEVRRKTEERGETADTLLLIESCWSETKSSVIQDQRSRASSGRTKERDSAVSLPS